MAEVNHEPALSREQVTAAGLAERLRTLLREGNVRRIVVKRGSKVLFSMSLTVGVVGTLVFPTIAVAAGLIGLASKLTLEIERYPAKGLGATREHGKVGKVRVSRPQPAVEVNAARSEPDKDDDLTAISGIGSKREAILKAQGITSFAQLAALSDAEVTRLSAEFSFQNPDMIVDWREQARSLDSY